MLSAAVASVILAVNSLPGSASAACGGQPPLPPEGLFWPTGGQIIKPWSLNCSTDSGHRGLDVALPEGTIIGAVADGVVSFVGYTPAEGGGTTVSITHDTGLKSTYLHISPVTVQEGARIRQGDPIGLSNGAPIHLGIKLSGAREEYFDPSLYLVDRITVQAATDTVPPQETPIPLTTGQAPPTPAGTGVDVAASASSTNTSSDALKEPAGLLHEQRLLSSSRTVTTVLPPIPLPFPFEDATRPAALSPDPSQVIAPELSSLRKLPSLNITPAMKDKNPVHGRYEKSADEKLLPFSKSITPPIAALLIAAIIMRGRKIHRLPAVRTA
jgi:hypothetical protein